MQKFVCRPPLTKLCEQNKGQGLGFKLGRTVLDTDKLKTVAAQAITGGGLVVAYMLAMASPPAGHEQCGLSAVQSGMIQAAMAERNASCALNMTLASILDATGGA